MNSYIHFFQQVFVFPWKERSEILLTGANGKVTSDLMAGRGEKLQGSQSSCSDGLTC